MNVLEKVRFLKEQYNFFPSPGIKSQLCFIKNNWQPGEIDRLKQEYPWLSQFYLDFIAEFDALGLAWVGFYGSDKCGIIPIREEIDYWKEHVKSQNFPFAKHPSGGIYTFNKNNEVIYFSRDDFKWETPEFIAHTLEEFIDNCLLGKRYVEFNYTEDDSFYQFLKDQGWA